MKAAWLVIAACSAPVAPHPARSRVEYVRHHAEALGVDKTYLVYVPAGYDDRPATRWPVFYYLHGISSPQTEWIDLGQLDRTADRMSLDAIVVMPDGDDSFYFDSPTPIDFDACMNDGTGLYKPSEDPDSTCVRHRAYETYITKELVADVDARYRTIASRDGRAVAGLSMGGYGALALGFLHPDEYAALASHSPLATLLYDGPQPWQPHQVHVATDLSRVTMAPRFRPWERILFGDDIATWRAHDPAVLIESLRAPPAIYIDSGTEDFLVDTTRFVDELLTDHHVAHQMYFGPGKHDYAFWVPRIAESLAFLRDHTSHAR